MAARAGFDRLTALQEKSFGCRDFYDINKWLFIMGATGAGKTLVALMSYFYEQHRAAAQGRSYRMLFAVPYRALASQKFDEITDIVRKLDLPLKVVQSTSEKLLDDDDIITGRVDIAVIINEKVFMFASADHTFLDKYDLIVLDEIALIQDVIRGIKTDFIMLQARRRPDIRVIALGTPFYNWREYVKKFRFVEIQEERRPIELVTRPMRHSKTVVTDLCREHVERGEKILIFLNSRNQVRELSQALQRRLIDTGILKPWIEPARCKNFVLDAIQADSEDILYGTMDDDDLRAFAHGISYHNADMPSPLRCLIEKDFLSVDGKLKIICSTETLAYGVNSNADVVIIPDMTKFAYDKTLKNRRRFLFPNEYMNYAGRAGRLNPNLPEQKSVGYVYPILNPTLDLDGKSQEILWAELNRKVDAPEVIFSRYPNVRAEYWSFYVLSLFANSRRRNSTSITQSDIEYLLKNLPLPSGLEADENFIAEPLQKLLERKLIRQVNEDEDDEEPEYAVTDVGGKLAGFVILFDDFEAILSAMRTFITPQNFFEVDLFDAIVRTEEIKRQGGIIIGTLKTTKNDVLMVMRAIEAMKKILVGARKRTSVALSKRLSIEIGKYEGRLWARDYNFFNEDGFRALRMLAAIILWRGSTCTPPRLYDELKIYYEQMRRLLEIVSYRLDVIRYSLPLAPGKKKLLRQELDVERLCAAEDWLKGITDALAYDESALWRR